MIVASGPVCSWAVIEEWETQLENKCTTKITSQLCTKPVPV